MRVTIFLLCLLVLFAATDLVPDGREAAELMSKDDAQATERAEKYETTPMNGAPQYTVIWVLPSFGGF